MVAAVGALILLLAVACPRVTEAQVAAQFVPSELSSNITSRLVFRQEGLATFWKDPGTSKIVLRDRVVLNPQYWRAQFQDTGGVAVLAPTNGLDFTITSDNASQVTPELNFSLLANAMLVGPGGRLVFTDVLLSDFSHVSMYDYTPAQPYVNMGVGWPLWPTVVMAPDSEVDVTNVSAAYQNPSVADTCEQYTERTVYALQQQYGNNVTAANATSILYKGPLRIPVVVYNGSDNSTIGDATAIVRNVSFHCVPRINITPATASGLAPGKLTAAIVVPVVVALAAAAAVWYCIRKRRQRRQAADSKDSDMVMDVEMAQGGRVPDAAGGHWDQQMQGVDKVPELPGHYGPGYYHTSSSSAATSSASVAPNTWSGSAPTSGGAMMPGTSNMPPYPYPAASGSTVTVPATPNALAMPPHGPLLAGMAASGLQTGSSQQYSSRHHSGSGGTGSQGGARYSSGWNEHPLDALPYMATMGSGDLDRRSLLSDGVVSAGRGSQVPGSAGSQGASAEGSQGRPSGAGSKVPSAASGGSVVQGTGGSGHVASDGSSSQALSSGSTAFGRSSGGVPALLKARSDMAVLRDLKIGPLLGRGSYGRVYKGRWKAVTVAVKIIEHMEGSPGTASSGGKKISIGREAQLATNIAHPNVVQTYQISTMTVSQRNALARTWIEEGNNNTSNLHQLPPAADAGEGGDNDSNSSNDGNDEPQKDVLETWMIMEFCEKGSLDRAVVRKRFVRKEDGRPEMIGIYKALLDTASGLDYLHSIGVVHGDLKTANVLLKGSTRDVRGFACKITDFGLSRVLDLDATHISTRTYGTIVYMPAELLLTGRMTHATDIYSFGLMMWELYTSSRIFNEGLSVGQIFYMIAYQGWRPEMPPDCPPGYSALMAACWHQDPEQRPTAQQVLRTLQKLYVQEKQAAAAAKEAMTAAKEAALAAYSAAAPSPSSAAGAPSHGSDGQQPGSDTSAHTGEGSAAGSGGPRAGQVGTGSSGGTPQRGSSNDREGVAAGRYARVSAGSGGAAGPSGASGSGGPATGSGGSVPHEGGEQREGQQYQPWAQAVSSRVGKQLQQDRQDEEPPQQYLTPRRYGWQQRAGPLQSVNEHTPVTGAIDTPGMTVGYGGSAMPAGYAVPQQQQQQPRQEQQLQQQSRYGAMEMQPGEDEGPPSELLYQNDSLISNIVPDEDAEDLDGPQGARYDADAQIAAGYLDAVQTAARQGPMAGVTTATGLAGLAPHAQQTPFQYQQQQRPHPGQRALPGSPSMQTSQGLSVSSSTLGGGWGSVSTGTMPSAMGGNSSLNLSLMASQSITSPTLGTGATVGPGGSGSVSSGGGRQQQQGTPRAAASPFAALAQRAGSLFGPLVKP